MKGKVKRFDESFLNSDFAIEVLVINFSFAYWSHMLVLTVIAATTTHGNYLMNFMASPILLMCSECIIKLIYDHFVHYYCCVCVTLK